MRIQMLLGTLAVMVAPMLVTPPEVDGQLGRLRQAAGRAVEDEAARQAERLIREAIRCAIDDPACYDAKGGGHRGHLHRRER